MKALHVPSNVLFEPGEVSDINRAGPWHCAWPGCQAILFHSRSFERKLAAGGTTLVAAKFSCFQDSKHSADPHGAPSRSDQSTSRSGYREHVHRLTDVPLPERVKKSLAAEAGTGAARTQYQYGAPVGGLQGLIAISRRIAAGEELSAIGQIRYSGTDYWWNELAFAPTGRSFSVLDATIRAQFQKNRAYYVEGAAKYHAYAVAGGERLELTLIDVSGECDQELSVFMPNEPYFRQAAADASSGTRFALFSFESFVKKTHRAALSLEVEGQLIVLDDQ